LGKWEKLILEHLRKHRGEIFWCTKLAIEIGLDAGMGAKIVSASTKRLARKGLILRLPHAERNKTLVWVSRWQEKIAPFLKDVADLEEEIERSNYTVDRVIEVLEDILTKHSFKRVDDIVGRVVEKHPKLLTTYHIDKSFTRYKLTFSYVATDRAPYFQTVLKMMPFGEPEKIVVDSTFRYS